MTTFADARGLLVDPPRPLSRSVRRRRKLALVLVALLVLSGAGYGVSLLTAAVHQAAARCTGLDATTEAGYALTVDGNECVGWTIEQAYPFSPEAADVVAEIVKQNQAVASSGRQYARIAVLMPRPATTARS
jgi:hypothetical protein